MSPLVIFLMGPTCAGKTTFAVELVQQLPLEIISVDSALIYRGMDIGTAKPDATTLARAPHRLIDICEPSERYSAAEFRQDALAAIAEVHARKRIPLLVGGTGLYFRALERGLSPLPAADAATRQRLSEEAAHIGWSGMHARLAQIDPAAAARIHPNDPQRIQRALEVYALTGRAMSEWWQQGRGFENTFEISKFALCPTDRSELHRRVAQRFAAMLEAGFLDEVRRLRGRGDLHPELPSMRVVGYRQAWQHLEGELDHAEMTDAAVAATRQLVKRQLTWLRREPSLHWADPCDERHTNALRHSVEQVVHRHVNN
ncbi:MAG: tRNA (adenosine(37)-N6)-dimethylallyltransferase MiaA [Gammaproteobacteria bacterium]